MRQKESGGGGGGRNVKILHYNVKVPQNKKKSSIQNLSLVNILSSNIYSYFLHS